MARVPFISRLPFRDYVALFLSLTLLLLESIIRFLTLLLPPPVIRWFRQRTVRIWHTYLSKPKVKSFPAVLQACRDFTEMCDAFGYITEEHVVPTKDGYLLCLHRLCHKKGEPYITARGRDKKYKKPVVYLHHGLFMNSEVWVCQIDEKLSLPFRLVEEGYDVWFGNNRGNKYSKKSLHYTSNKPEFWNFSMDEFAFYDIPDSIDYILHTTRAESLSYIGFSQGTAQAFAALSIHPQLNEKVNLFIALAPAMSPKGLSNSIVDSFIRASPAVLFLLFGRKALLTSTILWQSIIYPPIFVRMIDISCGILFGWTAVNIPFQQRVVSYAHLYSYTSVKTLVHWFQIIRAQTFQMYDDEGPGSIFGSGANFYKVAKFPTKNIYSPIALIYGGRDSLVDIDVMLAQLPPHTVAHKVDGYEHLDLLWGQNVDKLVIPPVLNLLKTFAQPVDSQGTKSLPVSSSQTSEITNGLRRRTLTQDSLDKDAVYGTGDRSIAAPQQFSSAAATIEHLDDASDSDQTMGPEDPDSPVKSTVRFAEATTIHS